MRTSAVTNSRRSTSLVSALLTRCVVKISWNRPVDEQMPQTTKLADAKSLYRIRWQKIWGASREKLDKNIYASISRLA